MQTFFLVCSGVLLLAMVEGCNEAVCGPIVTKCQLLKRCNCEMPTKENNQVCDCCSDCATCLEDKYQSCCSCVGMCRAPEPSENDVNASSVEDLNDPLPGLFKALTLVENSDALWTVAHYPAFESLLHRPHIGVNVDHEEGLVRFSYKGEPLSETALQNCSVAFVKKCTSLTQCKETCKSMGASKFRWFHDQGCCQCVGDKCIDYGRNYPMCASCRSDDYVEEVHFDDEL